MLRWLPQGRIWRRLGPAAAALLVVVAGWRHLAGGSDTARAHSAAQPSPSAAAPVAAPAAPVVSLNPAQLQAIALGPVGVHAFDVKQEAVGSVDFDENLSVPVYTPYPGKILRVQADVGDRVTQGQPLYTIDSPDLLQAESSLIAATASYELTSKELQRVRALYGNNAGVPQRELEQAVSDEATAAGALQTARDAVRIFGKSETEIDRIVAQRSADPVLVVDSPMTGEITARAAQPGLFEQPGNAPAPFIVTDTATKWMLASVPEEQSAALAAGQPVTATLMAFPGRVWHGQVDKIYATVDPTLHTATVRCVVADPAGMLRPGMLADFTIRVRAGVMATAVPADAVVREPDGSFVVWVTDDRIHFTQRLVTVGLREDGMAQIVGGLRRGETVVTRGGVFLSNMLEASPSD